MSPGLQGYPQIPNTHSVTYTLTVLVSVSEHTHHPEVLKSSLSLDGLTPFSFNIPASVCQEGVCVSLERVREDPIQVTRVPCVDTPGDMLNG